MHTLQARDTQSEDLVHTLQARDTQSDDLVHTLQARDTQLAARLCVTVSALRWRA